MVSFTQLNLKSPPFGLRFLSTLLDIEPLFR